MFSTRSVRAIAIVFALALQFLPSPGDAQPAGIGWDNTIVARRGKAKTVTELSALYDSTHCRDCHPKVYRAWELSAHSESIMGKRRPGRKALAWLTIFDVAKEEWPFTKLGSVADVKIEHLMGCARCHLPQLADAEDSVARELIGDFITWRDAKKNKDFETAQVVEEKLSELSVTCLICHNRNAVVHKWTDGFPSWRVVYGSANKPHPVGKFPAVIMSPIQDEALACGQCHGAGPLLDRESPTQCATGYGFYLFDYKARGGDEICQDCHMRKENLGHNIQSYRDPSMIKAALDFSVEVTPILLHGGPLNPSEAGVKDAPRLRVDVKMMNRAGHPIPDGCPTGTKLILDVTVKSADGSELFFDEKSYMPIPQDYARGDKMGRGPFEKTGLIINTALLPLRKVTERYDIPIAAPDEIEVSVKLTYLPYGSTKEVDDPIVWREFVKKLKLGEID